MLFKNEPQALAWLMAAGITVKFDVTNISEKKRPRFIGSLTFEVPSQEFKFSQYDITQQEIFIEAVNEFAALLQIESIKDSSSND